jgi:hypothetical protein
MVQYSTLHLIPTPPFMPSCRHNSPPFLVTLLCLGLLWTTTACTPDATPIPSPNNLTQGPAGRGAPAVQDLSDFRIGEAVISVADLEIAISQFRQAFNGFGHHTLSWFLLDGGIGPAALLHHRFAEQSAEVRLEAELIAQRLAQGEDFFSVYQEQGGDPAAPINQQPTPFSLGGRVAAQMATMEPGDWAGPLKTINGWEIVYLEERLDSLRSVAGVRVRTLLLEIGDASDRTQARDDWAKLPLSGNPMVIRSLPAAFRRGRVLQPTP